MYSRNSKRVKQEKEYRKACDEIDKELREAGKFRCYFTDQQLSMNSRPSHHHVKGRIGDLLTDKRFIVPCHDLPHLLYHDLSVEKLEKLSWYPGFLKRLKSLSLELYQKEIDKQDK